MTTDPTPTTHAAKAEAARQAARSSGLGSPAAMYFLGVAQTHAILEVAEQLRIHNLIVAVLIADSALPRTKRLLCARLLDAVTDTAALLLAIGIILGAVVAVIITLRLAAQLLGVLP